MHVFVGVVLIGIGVLINLGPLGLAIAMLVLPFVIAYWLTFTRVAVWIEAILGFTAYCGRIAMASVVVAGLLCSAF